jgi:hypothetical protein
MIRLRHLTNENHHNQILHGMHRHHAGLATEDPHALHYFLLQVTTDSLLLAPDLLTDVVHFCSAACQRLLWALYPEESTEKSAPVNVQRDQVRKWRHN